MTNPKILILGHARHGKDTFAELLAEKFGLKFVSSSYFCAERVMMPAFERLKAEYQEGSGLKTYWGPEYASVDECYADRVNHRAFWHNEIAAYNSPNKAKLASEVLEVADCYVGMRCNEEYRAVRPLFDHVVWVDASGRGMPPEPRDSFNINFREDMWVAINRGNLEEFELEAEAFGSRFLKDRVPNKLGVS